MLFLVLVEIFTIFLLLEYTINFFNVKQANGTAVQYKIVGAFYEGMTMRGLGGAQFNLTKIRLPRPFGFYSNGNNECNRNELGRQLIHQLDAL